MQNPYPIESAHSGKELTMAKVIFGNHSSVLVPRQDRDSIRKFYCDVLGGKITKADPERDFIRLGEDFFIGFLYGDVTDESEFLRSFRAIWLEFKSNNAGASLKRSQFNNGAAIPVLIPRVLPNSTIAVGWHSENVPRF